MVEQRSNPVIAWAREVDGQTLWARPGELERQGSRLLPGYRSSVEAVLADVTAQLEADKERREAALLEEHPEVAVRRTARHLFGGIVAVVALALALGFAGWSRTGEGLDPVRWLPAAAVSFWVAVAGFVAYLPPRRLRTQPGPLALLLAFLAVLGAVPLPWRLATDDGFVLPAGSRLWLASVVISAAVIVLLALEGSVRRLRSPHNDHTIEAADEDFVDALAVDLLARARQSEPRLAAAFAELSSADRDYVTDGLREAGAILHERGLLADPDGLTRHTPGMLELEDRVRIVVGPSTRRDVLVTEVAGRP